MEWDRQQDYQLEGFINGASPLNTIKELVYPFNYQCLIYVQTIYKDKEGKPQHSRRLGTGCLISKNIILTCRHIFISGKKDLDNLYAKQEEITVYAGLNGKQNKGVKCKVQKMRYLPYQSQKPQYANQSNDFAILLISSSDKRKNLNNIYKTFLPIYAPKEEKSKDYIIELYGYHHKMNEEHLGNDKQVQKFRLFGVQGETSKIEGDFIQYKISTGKGQSGAPIITYCQQGFHKIIGIHIIFDEKKKVNRAIKITQKIINKIQEWLEEWGVEQTLQNSNRRVAITHIQTNQKLRQSRDASFRQTILFAQDQTEIQILKNKVLPEANSTSNMTFTPEQPPIDLSKQQSHIEDQHPYVINTKKQLYKFTQTAPHKLQSIELFKSTVNLELIGDCCHALKDIVANKCNIIDIPDSFQAKEHLRIIDFRSNLIAKISKLFCPKLEILLLDDNKIIKIPQEIEKSPQLIQLNVKNNTISEVHPNLHNLKHLKKLQYDQKLNNLFSNVSKVIKQPNQQNEAKVLTQSFIMVKYQGQKIVGICIKKPSIINLPWIISAYPEILSLRINRCNLKTVPDSLSKNKFLQKIDFRYNNLVEIGNLFSENLLILILDHNKIKSIPPQVKNSPSLCQLNLSYNQLSSIHHNLRDLSELKAINLKKNPLKIDQTMNSYIYTEERLKRKIRILA